MASEDTGRYLSPFWSGPRSKYFMETRHVAAESVFVDILASGFEDYDDDNLDRFIVRHVMSSEAMSLRAMVLVPGVVMS